MEWVNSAVDDFCEISGLSSDFAITGRIQLSFERRGLLNIEVIQEQLVIFLSRELDWHRRLECQKTALRLCHLDQGWPFLIRAGMLGQEALVLSAAIELDEVTLPNIEQAFSLLTRLQDEVANA